MNLALLRFRSPVTVLGYRLIRTSHGKHTKHVQLICSPVSALIDEKVRINIHGLEPTQTISLYTKLTGDTNDKYHSLAHYIANSKGTVCLNSQPSVGGSYVGIEPMGFIWSLKPVPNQRPGRRLMKRDVTKPYLVNLTVLDGHVDILKTENIHPLCSLTIERHYMAAGVRRVNVHAGQIRGTLFLPPGDGPFQGVIDLVGAHGGLVEFKAALLASRGFAALALAYINYDDLPDNLEDLNLEYFIEAVDWLKDHPSIIPGGVGVMVISKGAEIGLLLATKCQDVKAIVFIAGFHGLSVNPMHYRDTIIPNIIKSNLTRIDRSKSPTEQMKIPIFSYNWSESAQDDHQAFAVEDSCASMLLIYGTDDTLIEAELAACKIYSRLKEHGKGSQCSVLGYHGAGHLIEPPYSPHAKWGYQKSFDLHLPWGGETKAHAYAQENAWAKILPFLRVHLPYHGRI